MRADDETPEPTGDRRPAADELLLQRFLDGELRATERRDLEARLAVDAALAGSLDRLRRTSEVLAESRPEPVPLTPGFGDRVWSELRRELTWEPLPASQGASSLSEAGALLVLKRWSLAAAAAVLLLTGLLVLWRPAGPTTLQAGPEVHEVLRDLDRRARQAEGTDAEKSGADARAEARRRAERRAGKTSDR